MMRICDLYGVIECVRANIVIDNYQFKDTLLKLVSVGLGPSRNT